MCEQKTVQWSELRVYSDGSFETYLVSAVWSSGRPQYSERSIWDIAWYEIAQTPGLRTKALSEYARQNPVSRPPGRERSESLWRTLGTCRHTDRDGRRQTHPHFRHGEKRPPSRGPLMDAKRHRQPGARTHRCQTVCRKQRGRFAGSPLERIWRT